MAKETFFPRLSALASQLGITLCEKQLEQFYTYYTFLVEKNKVMNLTAITEEEDVIVKHFVDSLALQKINVSRETFSDWCKGKRCMDVGTGAGFPGIVLKIAFPEILLFLSDSLQKRIHFLEELVEKLGLSGVEFYHGRAEDLGQNPMHRERYDLAVSRAVANLSTLSEYDLPFVKQDGYFIAMKSGNLDTELEKGKKAIHLLGGKLEAIEEYTLPETDIARTLLLIRKVESTAKKYPRKAGIPAKEPLG